MVEAGTERPDAAVVERAAARIDHCPLVVIHIHISARRA